MMSRVTVSKFKFGDRLSGVDTTQLRLPPLSSATFPLTLLRSLRQHLSSDVVFLSNPDFGELLFGYLIKIIRGETVRLILFDLILRAPSSLCQRIKARAQRVLLTSVDCIACIHQDTSGYERYYGIAAHRCRYVPFKANNFDIAEDLDVRDGGYILAVGASHRDYTILIEAVAALGYPLTVVVSPQGIQKHHSLFPAGDLPANVRHIDTFISRDRYNELLAHSKFVAIPIIPGVIQPAGISVYLEAMVLGKAVVITSGASTNRILDSQHAVLVREGDVEDMRRALVALWSDDGLRSRLGASGREYAVALGGHDRLAHDLAELVRSFLRPSSA